MKSSSFQLKILTGSLLSVVSSWYNTPTSLFPSSCLVLALLFQSPLCLPPPLFLTQALSIPQLSDFSLPHAAHSVFIFEFTHSSRTLSISCALHIPLLCAFISFTVAALLELSQDNGLCGLPAPQSVGNALRPKPVCEEIHLESQLSFWSRCGRIKIAATKTTDQTTQTVCGGWGGVKGWQVVGCLE